MSTNNESKSPGYDAKEYIEKFLSTESVGKVFDVMNLGAVLLARDFTVIYVNEAICRILAVSKDKIMNKNILSLFKKDEERELAKEILSLRTKGVSSRYEIKLTNGRNEIPSSTRKERSWEPSHSTWILRKGKTWKGSSSSSSSSVKT